MKKITDPTFRYTPSFNTDLKKKFKRMKQEAKENRPPPVVVVNLRERKKP